ncbi:hypothetical protein CAPTEDRAFT_111013 [Capitella teleta]|uniref:Reverse transcriptase domain-containing protein n=1 Tax=Capitella teleta TaxID=283909 RepID=R7U0M5_CAPTE|nr:hypothetical protein CAPTEDRAFT_111013 [Capitella teleta]|eukprot:ELT99559.1 hypothetical protein CAPTEDRAFT_111013 [Capitella teleta]
MGVLLDFQKTFDTVQHKILLSKLLRYKIRGTPHSWFTNYTYRVVNEGLFLMTELLMAVLI